MNKRGMSFGRKEILIVAFVLIVVLVIIIGLMNGWFSSGNSDEIIEKCETACSVQSVYDYCTKDRQIKEDITGSCNSLSSEYPEYKVPECSGLCN